jgi:hypothetical protein
MILPRSEMSEVLCPVPEVGNGAVIESSATEPLAWREGPFIKACGFI